MGANHVAPARARADYNGEPTDWRWTLPSSLSQVRMEKLWAQSRQMYMTCRNCLITPSLRSSIVQRGSTLWRISFAGAAQPHCGQCSGGIIHGACLSRASSSSFAAACAILASLANSNSLKRARRIAPSNHMTVRQNPTNAATMPAETTVHQSTSGQIDFKWSSAASVHHAIAEPTSVTPTQSALDFKFISKAHSTRISATQGGAA